mmetsp:Transcript_15842/g.37360  ORF Transcript_15842/g.37360 Transcript_15842/m.37360 type:complete len:84 (+) Transcript_15842:181-432(+)
MLGRLDERRIEAREATSMVAVPSPWMKRETLRSATEAGRVLFKAERLEGRCLKVDFTLCKSSASLDESVYAMLCQSRGTCSAL